jgi:four helix bundle protein
MIHKDLDVWTKSIEFVTVVYKQTGSFPKEEIYGLTSQIRRAAISIPSNIAEGAARRNKTEFRQFLYISLASTAEIETQLIISVNLNYISQDIQSELTSELTIISKMLQGLIKSLNIQN